MTHLQQHLRDDLRRKNGWIFKILVMNGLLSIGSLVGLGASLDMILMNLIGNVVMLGFFAFFHFRHRAVTYIPFIPIVGYTLITFGVSMLKPDFVNVFAVFVILILSMVYMYRSYLLTGIICGLVLILYILFGQSEVLGLEKYASSSAFYLYILGSVILLFFSKVTGSLVKDIAASSSQSQTLYEQMSQQKEHLLQETSGISTELTSITAASIDNLEAFRRMGTAFEEMTEGANEQAASTQTITDNIYKTSQQLTAMTEAVHMLNQQAAQAKVTSHEGGLRITEMDMLMKELETVLLTLSQSMKELDGRITETEGFNQVIRAIADQTNLLSVNASIEAARSGQYGAGFSIIASEIRKLSESAGDSAKRISNNLSDITMYSQNTLRRLNEVVSRVAGSSETTSSARAAFQQIDADIGNLNGKAEEMERMITGVTEANQSTYDVTHEFISISQQTAATMEELKASVDELLYSNERSVQSLRQADQRLNNMQV
ncbi:methyl-accepting chemotaxis sensory transducer [Paenibacillus algicola]|uniref:Methyl-accepting chemotaxis sensory transducer n=1 Tax=Paenibacillus algicola TaxID=2565926 RepID=A0A4P8XN16_9BACL|nr:methyl-accepting chemotaxis protein [Paenibacillus algicola]QCT01699.1 methyl-accepting chemotaxis sensory transducer [Paenibacillus algicola]